VGSLFFSTLDKRAMAFCFGGRNKYRVRIEEHDISSLYTPLPYPHVFHHLVLKTSVYHTCIEILLLYWFGEGMDGGP